MESHRLPRFKRAPVVALLQLTERDRTIVRLVHRHRFLRSSHIAALVGGSRQQVLRRLQLLYHHGFLERPRVQIEYYHLGGSKEIVYGLGKVGYSLLNLKVGAEARNLLSEGSRAPIKRPIFEHDLQLSDIMVALELSCRKAEGVRLIAADELPRPGGWRRSIKWRVKMNDGNCPGIIPDRAFAIVSDEPPEQLSSLFFLELDRGTVPIVRTDPRQTSFYRKLLAYEATWSQGLHRSQFGFQRFRVLTVTTSAARVDSLIEACSKLKSGHGLFIFIDLSALQKHGDMLTCSWKNGRGEIAGILK